MTTMGALLQALVAELADDRTVAIGLTGSHARGDAAEYSDLDVWHFAAEMPEDPLAEYTLRQHGSFLVSLTTSTIHRQYDKLSRPDGALTAVPGLRQMRVLLDQSGALAALIQAAQAFRWEAVQAEADVCASYDLMGYAEEAHKVMNGLAQADDDRMVYGLIGLILGMTRVVALHKGVLADSENTYFQQVRQAMGVDSAWARNHRLALGLQVASPALRAQAGLRLYRETAALLRPVVLPEHAAVIDHTLERLTRFVG